MKKTYSFVLLEKSVLDRASSFSNPSYLALTASITSFGTLLIGILYAFDFLNFSGVHVYDIFNPMLEMIFSEVPLDTAPMQLFYYIAALWGVIVGLGCAIYAFIVHGSEKNYSITLRAKEFLGGVAGSVMVFIVGYILSVPLIEATALTSVPFIEVLQAVIAAKAMGYLSVGFYCVLSALLPRMAHLDNYGKEL